MGRETITHTHRERERTEGERDQGHEDHTHTRTHSTLRTNTHTQRPKDSPGESVHSKDWIAQHLDDAIRANLLGIVLDRCQEPSRGTRRVRLADESTPDEHRHHHYLGMRLSGAM